MHGPGSTGPACGAHVNLTKSTDATPPSSIHESREEISTLLGLQVERLQALATEVDHAQIVQIWTTDHGLY